MLFTGCIATILDRETLEDSVAVLERLGVDAIIPEGQTCCGALDQHAGRRQTAKRLADCNLSAFHTVNETPIICTASGCAATLLDYARLSETPSAAGFTERVQDISTYLEQLAWPETARLAALPVRVLVHTPCTLANVLKSADVVLRLLERIPAIRLLSLPVDTGCCGAAGSYLINQPQTADTLAEDTVAKILALQPDMIATSNIGCALQLRAALARAGHDIPVKHPVSILRSQLETTAV